MSGCKHLHTYLDGDIQEHGRRQFETHLSECPHCATAVAEWQTIVKNARKDAAHQVYRSNGEQNIARQKLEASFNSQVMLSPWQKLMSRPEFGVGAALMILVLVAGIYGAHRFLNAVDDKTFKAAAVQVTGFRNDGTVYNAIKPRGATISATPNEQLLATVGDDRVAVGPRAKMIVRKSNSQGTRLRLKRGWIACRVARRPKGTRFVTRTFDDRFTVEVKGTQFGVQYKTADPKNNDPLFQVAVTEGVVAVKESQTRAWTLTAGQQLVIQMDGGATVSAISPKNRRIVASLLNPASASADLTAALEPPKNRANNQTPPKDRASARPVRRRGKSFTHKRQRDKTPVSTEAAPVSVAEMKRWIGSGRHRDAIPAIEARLVSEPANSELWRLLAESRRKSGDFQGALVAYRQVIEYGPPQVANAARYKMGLLYQNQLGQPKNAVIQFSRYLASEPTLLRAEALFHLGRAEYSAGDKTNAKIHLNEVIEEHGATAAAVKSRKLLQKMQ